MTPSRAKPQTRLLLSGFFGRGNCGDEAMLQAQYESLSPHHEILISVDERGAQDGFWDRYPYDRCRIVHQANCAVLAEPGVVGIHVGGGGLHHGFNAAQVVFARSLGKPAFLTGVDAHEVSGPSAKAAMGGYLGLFDLISVRSTAAWWTMSGLVTGCHRGADWAAATQAGDSSGSIDRAGVLVTMREFPVERMCASYVDAIARLLSVLSDTRGRVTLVPFCPEDDRFLGHLRPTDRFRREAHWWSPQEMQRLISTASLVVSVGRLHPLILAANAGTPCMFADVPRFDLSSSAITKGRQLCMEHGWPCFTGVAEMADWLRQNPAAAVPKATFSSGYGNRRREMADLLVSRLAAAGGLPGLSPEASFSGDSALFERFLDAQESSGHHHHAGSAARFSRPHPISLESRY